jgi:Nitrile hydratase, alpha chain
MAEQRTRRDVELQLIEKAWKDDAFRQALVSDPRGAVEKELGGQLPAGLQVKVLAETSDTFYLVLPANPDRAPAGELTDQQLEAVAGGAWTDPTCHSYCDTCNTQCGTCGSCLDTCTCPIACG